MNKPQQTYYAKLHRKALNGKRKTVKEALAWLEANYTGETSKAIQHQMYAESWETTVELQLREVYRVLIKNSANREI